MLGNFEYYNPTKLYFGKDALEGLNKEHRSCYENQRVRCE